MKKSHVWSRLIMVSASPIMPAHWVLTKDRWEAGPAWRLACHCRGSSDQVALMCSQNSTGTTWRTARVFSRAAASAPAMEDRLCGSVASRSVACHSVSVPLSGSPITASSRRAEADPSTSLCSRAWYTDTSRIRAVPSARST